MAGALFLLDLPYGLSTAAWPGAALGWLAVSAVLTLPLALRRRAPLTVAVVVLGGAVAGGVLDVDRLGFHSGLFGVAVAVYTLRVHRGRRVAGGYVAAVVAAVVAWVVATAQSSALWLMFPAIAWVAGELVAARVDDELAALRRQRQLAAAQERSRIAR